MAMARHRVANPVIILDEVDKASDDRRNGRITDTLLAMLEPETARTWFDEALMEAVDLSHISWVLTANDASGLPRPLLSRLTVVEAGAPGAEHFERLLSGICADLAAELDIPPAQLPDLMPEAVDALGKAFENGTDIRTLKRAVTRALAQGGERVVQ
jgi:ATP-dependent Lon protease